MASPSKRREMDLTKLSESAAGGGGLFQEEEGRGVGGSWLSAL